MLAAQEVMEIPPPKRIHLEQSDGRDSMTAVASKTRIVLALCGSFSPVTNLHLRMFGKPVQPLLCSDLPSFHVQN